MCLYKLNHHQKKRRLMQSHDKKNQSACTVERTSLLLVAISLNFLEFFIPRIPLFPWLKPGLANCITLVWIVKYGTGEAFLFSLLRIWTVGFYFGFSFLTLSLGLGGSIFAVAAMGAAWHILGKRQVAGIIGISITGALFHNAGQLVMVYFLMANNPYLFYQVPLMAIAAIGFGTITGLIAGFMLTLSEKTRPQKGRAVFPLKHDFHELLPYHLIATAGIAALCIAILFIDSLAILGIAAASTTLFVQVLVRGSLRTFLSPITKFWMLFVCIGALHLFFTLGTRIESIPGITREGARMTLVQWLRIWTWLQVTHVLTRFRFHLVFFAALKKLFKDYGYSLDAGLLAVEIFPSIPGLVRKEIAALARHFSAKRSAAVGSFFESLYEKTMLLVVDHLQEVAVKEE
ncbi:MAG: hypothetical protein GF350_14865 [Chitinivibrionales bacterium]|nr:hypothetical protein [Chitinivibrionales bacterium]